MNNSEIVIYQTVDGLTKIDIRMGEETLWLTQAQMVDMFQSSKANISEHIKHIFDEGELHENSVVRKFRTTAADSKNYYTKHYSLDVILAVGYRVKSVRGTQFRQWATAILHEYLQKGFAMNDEKLKEFGGGDYWYELLERIRDIRSSEKALYRQVLDLYATSIDYNPRQPETFEFYDDVLTLLQRGREKAATAVNSAMVETYWHIGKRIVEEEQNGSERAKYGEYLLTNLSRHLTDTLGKGVSSRNAVAPIPARTEITLTGGMTLTATVKQEGLFADPADRLSGLAHKLIHHAYDLVKIAMQQMFGNGVQ